MVPEQVLGWVWGQTALRSDRVLDRGPRTLNSLISYLIVSLIESSQFFWVGKGLWKVSENWVAMCVSWEGCRSVVRAVVDDDIRASLGLLVEDAWINLKVPFFGPMFSLENLVHGLRVWVRNVQPPRRLADCEAIFVNQATEFWALFVWQEYVLLNHCVS